MKLHRLLLFETKRRLKRRMIWLFIAITFLPALLVLWLQLLNLSGLIPASRVLQQNVNALIIQTYPLLFIATIIIATGTIGEDRHDGSIALVPCLPFSKTLYLWARLLSTIVIGVVSLAASVLMLFAVYHLSVEGFLESSYTIFRTILGLSLGIAVLTTVFNFIGLVFRRGYTAAFIYYLLWESVFSYVLGVQKLTILYYVRNLLPMPESGLKAMLAVLDKDPPTTATAIGILLVIGVIFAFAGYYVFRKKQFTIKTG